MNKSQKILFNDNLKGKDIYTKIRLQQDVDRVEFLSLNISTEEVYQNFNSDYGVLVGRVIANGGVGIPNAKISIFIPLSDEDATNSNISSIYPYKTPRDKNNEGKRYNLLPRVGKFDSTTGQSRPKQPFGSFPIKEEIVTNIDYLDIYKKYYKYTALTNEYGDYMIFGVPVGLQTVHMSVDITDIGEYSMNPASMVINLGYSPNLFTDNNTKIKPSKDLNDLPNIETQEISVEIIPFWGDTENFEIGITRQDFRIRSVLTQTVVLFGSAFTDGEQSMWGSNDEQSMWGSNDDTGRNIAELYLMRANRETNIGMASKRIGEISETIYYYPPEVLDVDIDSGNVDPQTQIRKLDKSEYTVHKREGDFVFIITCNRKKIISDDNGNKFEVSYDSDFGVFTEFRGFVILELDDSKLIMNFSDDIGNNTTVKPFRYKLKFPQYSNPTESFEPTDNNNTDNWRKQSFRFKGGKLYSFSRFQGILFNDHTSTTNAADEDQFDGGHPTINGFFRFDHHNNMSKSSHWNVGIINTDDYDEYSNSIYKFPSNGVDTSNHKSFGGNWMNFSVHFPQIGYLTEGDSFVFNVRSSDHFTMQLRNNKPYDSHFFFDNFQKIVAGDYNTKWFARSDFNWTDFVEVPLSDITMMIGEDKGFIDTGNTYSGNYRNGSYIPSGSTVTTACPFNGGKVDGISTNILVDPKTYFYKGLGDADCIDFLLELGIIN